MRLMMHVRSRNELPEAFTRSLDVALPGMPADFCDEISKHVASPSTLSKSQCKLDAAILMLQQRLLAEKLHFYYVIADSSPQVGYMFPSLERAGYSTS